MSSNRRIAHLDMDAFFASVELLRQPELRGLPVAIGGIGDSRTPEGRATLLNSRGVLTTATYEARAFGCRSGQPIRTALRLCPHLIVLPVNFAAYRHYSILFKAAVAEIADCIEDRGIDEIYIDLTEVAGDSRSLAQAIKARVTEVTGLTCSIGIAPNKLIAKIASDLDKPNGLTLITEADIPTRLWPLPVSKINGVGPKADGKLEQLGIRTIGDLAAAEPHWLVRHFGQNYGRWLADAGAGRDTSPVETHQEPKSRSREITFPHDTRDPLTLLSVIVKLSKQVAADLAAKGYAGRSVGVKVKFDNFEQVTRDRKLSDASADFTVIRDAAVECLRRVPIERKLRLLGVKVADLELGGGNETPVGQTRSLFD